jgi:hypothetical protein
MHLLPLSGLRSFDGFFFFFLVGKVKEKKRKRIFFLFLALHFGGIKESHTKPDFVDGSCLLLNALLYTSHVYM